MVDFWVTVFNRCFRSRVGHDVLVLDEEGPGVFLAGGSMVISINNYMHRSKDLEALQRQVRRLTRSMNQARTEFADATPLAGQPKPGEFLRTRATMPQPPLPPSSTTPTTAVPTALLTAVLTAVPTAVPTAAPSDKTAAPKGITAPAVPSDKTAAPKGITAPAVPSDKTAAPKGITAHPQLAKFLRPLPPRRPPPEIRQEEEEEEHLIRQAEERLAKPARRGSLKQATVAAAMANVRMRDRVREAAAEACAAHDSSTTTSSSKFEPSLAHNFRLRAKTTGRRVSGKQQPSEAVKGHAQSKKVKASAVAEAKRVVRGAKDVSAKPKAVPEQAAKDHVAKGQTATGQAAKRQAGTEKAAKDQVAKGQTAKGKAPKPQAATIEGGNKLDPTAGFVADWVAARNEAAKLQEANEDEPEEQPEEPAQVRPFELHLNYGRPNSTTSNIELEPVESRLNSV